MTNSREPVYHASNPKLRVVSCPNGLWQAQRSNGQKGTNATPRKARKIAKTVHQHSDPWQPLHSPTTFDIAMDKMNSEP